MQQSRRDFILGAGLASVALAGAAQGAPPTADGGPLDLQLGDSQFIPVEHGGFCNYVSELVFRQTGKYPAMNWDDIGMRAMSLDDLKRDMFFTDRTFCSLITRDMACSLQGFGVHTTWENQIATLYYDWCWYCDRQLICRVIEPRNGRDEYRFDVRLGVGIRCRVKIIRSEVELEESLPFVMAAAQLNKLSASLDLQRIGLTGAVPLAAPTTMGMDGYGQVCKCIEAAKSYLESGEGNQARVRPEVVGAWLMPTADARYQRSVWEYKALQHARDGHKLEEALREQPPVVARDEVYRQVYEDFLRVPPEGPTHTQRARARALLDDNIG